MTKTLFTNARLIDPVALTDAPGALLVENGIISQVFDTPMPDMTGPTVVDCHGKCLAPGIVDIGVKPRRMRRSTYCRWPRSRKIGTARK